MFFYPFLPSPNCYCIDRRHLLIFVLRHNRTVFDIRIDNPLIFPIYGTGCEYSTQVFGSKSSSVDMVLYMSGQCFSATESLVSRVVDLYQVLSHGSTPPPVGAAPQLGSDPLASLAICFLTFFGLKGISIGGSS